MDEMLDLQLYQYRAVKALSRRLAGGGLVSGVRSTPSKQQVRTGRLE
jgi:hypothetical protein